MGILKLKIVIILKSNFLPSVKVICVIKKSCKHVIYEKFSGQDDTEIIFRIILTVKNQKKRF